MAVFVLMCLEPPIKSDALHVSWGLEVLAGPNPTKITGHDLHKAAVWCHEIVVDQTSTMQANLKQTANASKRVDASRCHAAWHPIKIKLFDHANTPYLEDHAC